MTVSSDAAPALTDVLAAFERKVLWLSTWTIHNANHLRPKGEVKVGGHQASSASLVTLMTALYFHLLRPEDRIAVKPHASPAFHAIQYLLGNQSRENLENFRALGGAQSYPSRTKDADDVDFSTGSVGMGVAMTAFASLVQDYVRAHGWGAGPEGRMVALMGDAEMDEGNVFEALFEGSKHGLRNTWWIIDYNRQSLDAVVREGLQPRIAELFRAVGWDVVVLKYGRLMEAAFAEPGGHLLRQWIDDCPNQLYSALTFQGGAAWRARLLCDIGQDPAARRIVERRSDADLAALMTNLGGHDLGLILDTFGAKTDDRPTCFICYTVKGYGLPLAGHKDNHAGMLTPEQVDGLRAAHGVRPGREWERFEGLDLPERVLRSFLDAVPFNRDGPRRRAAAKLAVPAELAAPVGERASTQEGFGRILMELGRDERPFAARIVTTSPDVTVSTNLGGWVNRRGIFNPTEEPDVFHAEHVVSPQRWAMGPAGQHLELGIAENNLFTLLAALGLSHSLFGERLLPIGTVYDPFIQRGLDALNYACYQDARFILAATPSGVTLAPEGGAHQSIGTPLIGMAQDGLAHFEPAYVDELATILAWALEYVQRDGKGDGADPWLREDTGGSVYLRLSTRPIEQLPRSLDRAGRDAIIAGGYWLRPPSTATGVVVAYCGAVAPEALSAVQALGERAPATALLAVTSPDRLNAGWHAAQRARRAGRRGARAHVEELLSAVPRDAVLVTAHDAHPTALSWLGSVRGHRVAPLGVEHFGQSGGIDEVYRLVGLDADTIARGPDGAA